MPAKAKGLKTKAQSAKTTIGRRRPAWGDQDYEGTNKAIKGVDVEDQEEEGDEMSEMLEILQQLQKKRSSAASTRNASVLVKKNALVKSTQETAEMLKSDGAAHIENCRSALEEFHSSEIDPSTLLEDAYQLFGDRVQCTENLLEAYHPLLTDFRENELAILAQVNETLSSHAPQREMTRKRLMKKAKNEVLDNMEQRKLATDAFAYIKEFKKLVLI